ncbi:MAG: hypothetical protein GF330_11030 [Candidatus Eisenbacteria bacterium]|nr:hypothetical protein [Candidatus Eisenbacteria bacterium]
MMERILNVLKSVTYLAALVAIVAYFDDCGRRRDQTVLDAWALFHQVKEIRGEGGREQALETLADNGESLAGIDVCGAQFPDLDLPGADLGHACLDSVWAFEADLRGARMHRVSAVGAILTRATLEDAVLRRARLQGASFEYANLSGANLWGADLSDARLAGAKLVGSYLGQVDFSGADLRNCDLRGIRSWRRIRSLMRTNLWGVVNPPRGFIAWARDTMGAIQDTSSSH